ncbi:MAG: radical SAM protein [Actinobacteria bacterium]|nr:radical SAM protein [Actinomycetota bacterium]
MDQKKMTMSNISTIGVFKDALRVSIKRPSLALFFLKTIISQKRAQRNRLKWIGKGIQVPPVMIFSITDKCNLNCKGCYNKALRIPSKNELDTAQIIDILDQARKLGIAFIVIAGGEPFVRKDFLKIIKTFPELIFLVFTNGLLIDDILLEEIKSKRNVVPVISIEGHLEQTGHRRGEGVFNHLKTVIGNLNNESIFFGTSLTVTRQNFECLTDDAFVADLIEKGCKLFFYVEYTPITEGTENWVPTTEQRKKIPGIMDRYRKKFSALFVGLPAEEEMFGGCLSAGRGFIHVNAKGDLEPCPFAPFSDVNLKDMTLKEALKSRLLKEIRKNQSMLDESEGGCSLWANRKWVETLLK